MGYRSLPHIRVKANVIPAYAGIHGFQVVAGFQLIKGMTETGVLQLPQYITCKICVTRPALFAGGRGANERLP